MRRKKDLGKFLNKKKSWKKILQYLEKYLNKYGNWNYTYEFDRGSININIISSDSDKLLKTQEQPAEPKCEGFKANKRRLPKRKQAFK